MSERLAAIDIGTNSVRLLISEVAGRDGPDAPGSHGSGGAARLATLDRRMRITRLGQGVDARRRLHPDAIERTLAVLHEYRAALDQHGVTRARASATSAARDAANRDELFAAAAEVLGFVPELLSGAEEARLSFLGATYDLGGAPAPYLVVDIGGGSTEFVLGTTDPEALVSLDVGCVRVSEQFLHGDPPTSEELSNAISVVRDHLADVERALPGLAGARTLVGLAGTITTVAAVEMGLAEYDADRIHHFQLTKAAAEDVFRTLATEPAVQRRHNPGLEPGRVDVIVGGALMLVAILRTFGFEEVLVSEHDILDGLVLTLRG